MILFSIQERCSKSVGLSVALTDVYVFPTGLYNEIQLLLHIINPCMAMNYYAIQIFHARLKVKILKYDVNLERQQQIIIQKSAFLLFEYVTRDSTSEQEHLTCNTRLKKCALG